MFYDTIQYNLKDIKFPKQNLIIKNSFLGIDKRHVYDWQSLEKKLLEEGYNPKKYCYVTISNDGYLFDGHHRISVLQHIFKNEENKKIWIKKSKMNYKLALYLILGVLIILSPIAIPLFLLEKIKSVFKQKCGDIYKIWKNINQ